MDKRHAGNRRITRAGKIAGLLSLSLSRMHGRTGVLAALATPVAALLLGCAGASKYYDPQKPHHTPRGFRNNYLQGEIGGSFLKWQWERHTRGLPRPPENGYRFPMVKPDVAWLRANRTATAATWIGHATVLLQVAGANILTDPVLSERASPLPFIGPRRKTPPALDAEELPHIDIVLISHNHYDHLDRDTVRKLNAQAGGPPLFLVPLGIADWMTENGITNVRELDWWDSTEACGLEFHFVPAQHWSARGLNDRYRTLWGGWVAKTDAQAGVQAAQPFSFYFTGDTGYSKDFADIGRRFGGFDLALLPIGAYAPRWFMAPQHVDPGEAVRIHQDVGARQSIAIHWGTFEMSDEPLDAPPKLLAQELEKAGIPPEKFAVLKLGGTMRF